MSRFEKQPTSFFERIDDKTQTKAVQKARSKESESQSSVETAKQIETNREDIEYIGKQFALKQGFDAILTEMRKAEREAALEQISQTISPEKISEAQEKVANLTMAIKQLHRDFEPDFENIEQSYQDYERNSSREKFLNKINDNITERTGPEYIEDVLKEQGPVPIINDLEDIKHHLVTADAAQRILTISISKKEKDAKGIERVAERKIIKEGEEIEPETLKKNGWTIERIGELPNWEKQQKQAEEESLRAEQIIDQFKKARALKDYEALLRLINQEYTLITDVGKESEESKKQELISQIGRIQQEANGLKIELAIKEELLGKNKAEQRAFRHQGELKPEQEQTIQTKLKILLGAQNTQNTKEKEIDLAEANIDYLQSLLEERKEIRQLEEAGALTEEELKTLNKEIALTIKELSGIIPAELQESAAKDAKQLKQAIEQMLASSAGSLDRFSANALRWYKDGIGEFLARHPNLSPKLKSVLEFTEVVAATGITIVLGNMMIGCGGERAGEHEGEAKDEFSEFLHQLRLSPDIRDSVDFLPNAENMISQHQAEAVCGFVFNRDDQNIRHTIQSILPHSENLLIRQFLETVEKINSNFSDISSYKQYLEVMIPEFVNNKIAYSEFVAMAVDIQKRWEFMTHQPDLAKYHPLIIEIGRDIVKNQLNYLHNRPDRERFASVENASAEELYSVIISGDLAGEYYHYPSTLNGLFKRFLSSIENGADFLEKINNYQYRKFMLLGSFSNCADEFLATMEPARREVLVKNLIQGIEDGVKSGIERDMQGIMIADILKDISKNSENKTALNSLVETLKNEYQRANNNSGLQFVYGSSASILQNSLNSENQWLKEMAQEYPAQDFSRLDVKELLNEKGEYIEQVFFLKGKDNDYDMETTFENFMEEFQDSSKWTIEEKSSFYIITSIDEGNKIKIYANKFTAGNPEIETKACADVANHMLANNEKAAGLWPRGHMWHIREMVSIIEDFKAIKKWEDIYTDIKFIGVAGCSGFNHTPTLTHLGGKIPQIISNKSVNSKYVVGPWTKIIHQSIQQGEEIVWDDKNKQVQQMTGEREEALNMVMPNENSLLLLDAIKQARQTKEAESFLVAAR